MKKPIVILLTSMLLLTLFPAEVFASPDIQSILEELAANIQTDISDLTNDGFDADPVMYTEDDDRIKVDLNFGDLDSLISQYAPEFNGGDVKMELAGEPVDCLRFLSAFDFGSLDLEFYGTQGMNEELVEESHGFTESTLYRLADVRGLKSLTMEDTGSYSTNMNTDDVFETLEDLTLRYYGGYDSSIFGNLTSRQMPSLKHMTLLLNGSTYLFDLTRNAGLLFPEGLETLDIYDDDELMNPEDITDPYLIEALQLNCPSVLVNGVSLSALTPAGEADATAEDLLRLGKNATIALKALDSALHETVPLSSEPPHVYGKLLFFFFNDGYYDFNISGSVKELERVSAQAFENQWEYYSPATPEEQAGTFGEDSGIIEWVNREVPPESLAGSYDDADTMVIIYTKRTLLGEHNGDETPYRVDTGVVILDTKNGIIYSPFIANDEDPYNGSYLYTYGAEGYDLATTLVMDAYNGDGYINSVTSVPSANEPENTVNAPESTEGQSADAADSSLPPQGLIADILAVLNNSTYSDTLAALQGGETITQGTSSQTAAGLQQTLADLGCSIAIDGSAGPGTFSTLNGVLSSFGMDETTVVDAALYGELLKLLLIATDETAARDLLADEFEGEDSGKFEYMMGCVYYAQGKFYSAKEAFENSYYRDYAERAAACVQPWPENGVLWLNNNYYSNAMVLHFQVNSADDDKGQCFKVYAEDGTLAAALFLTGSGTVSVNLPGGVYKIDEESGNTWYGLIDSFGPDGYYEHMVFGEYEDDDLKTWLGSGYEWTISVNVSNTGGTGVGSESFGWGS